jgi:hypothetical protein
MRKMASQVEVVEAVVRGPVMDEGQGVGPYHADDSSSHGGDDDGTDEES